MKTYKLVRRIIFRILISPFMIILLLIAALWKVGEWYFTFLKYGGEILAYSKDFNPETIGELLENIQKSFKPEQK